MCGKEFKSEGNWNRRCRSCQYKVDYNAEYNVSEIVHKNKLVKNFAAGGFI